METKSEPIRIRSVLKDIVVEWCLSSTSHGIPNIARTNSTILRLVWFFCFLISTTYCLYSVGQSISDFAQYNTYVSTKIVQEIPTNFPAVSICNRRFTNKTKSKAFLDQVLYVSGVPIFQPRFFGLDIFRFGVSQLFYMQSLVTGSRFFTAQQRRLLGFEINDMIISCRFNWEPCSDDDFTYFYNPVYGSCFTYNKGVTDNGTIKEIKQVAVPGPDYGLNLQLFTGDPAKQSQYELYEDIVVVVHNQTTLPLLNNDRILVNGGSETDIKVSRNFISKLDAPYSNCLKDTTSTSSFSSEYFDYMVHSMNISYNQQYCYLLCLQKKIQRACNCSLALIPGFDSSSLCLKNSDVDCLLSIVMDFSKNRSSDNCVHACPLECYHIDYGVSTSKNFYPTPYFKSILASHPKINSSGIAYSDIEKSTLRLNVFYELMQYTQTQEIAAVSFETFMSNIGGTLGLYIGISFLSFVEVIELIIIVIKTIVEYSFKRKQVDNIVVPEITVVDVSSDQFESGSRRKRSNVSKKFKQPPRNAFISH